MWSELLDLFYPKLCVLCSANLSKSEEFVCFNCLYVLPKTNYLNQPENAMAKNLWGRVNINHAAAFLAFRKGNKVQDLLHLIKYKNKKELGVFMGKQMGIAMSAAAFKKIDVITMVPLHPKKEVLRGYNQSEMLANGLAEILNIPIIKNNLVRTSSHTSQTKKSRFERWINVKEKFVITDPTAFENKHVLLVDDVFTTGATLEACIQCINACHQAQSSAYTLAFTL